MRSLPREGSQREGISNGVGFLRKGGFLERLAAKRHSLKEGASKIGLNRKFDVRKRGLYERAIIRTVV